MIVCLNEHGLARRKASQHATHCWSSVKITPGTARITVKSDINAPSSTATVPVPTATIKSQPLYVSFAFN